MDGLSRRFAESQSVQVVRVADRGSSQRCVSAKGAVLLQCNNSKYEAELRRIRVFPWQWV